MIYLEIAKNILAIIAFGLAIYGYKSWRQEHIGKKRIELAEDVLALFYETYDVINYMRDPISFSSEADDSESVVFKRYNEYKEAFFKLRALRYRFFILIGKSEAEPFDEIQKIARKILASARILKKLRSINTFPTENHEEENLKNIKKHEAIIWEDFSEPDPDPINSRLEKAIDEIESTCKSIITGKGSFWRPIPLYIEKLVKCLYSGKFKK